MEKLTILELINIIRNEWKHTDTLSDSDFQSYVLQKKPLDLLRLAQKIVSNNQTKSSDAFDLSVSEKKYDKTVSSIQIAFVSESNLLEKIETLKSMISEKKLIIQTYSEIKVSMYGLSVGSAGISF